MVVDRDLIEIDERQTVLLGKDVRYVPCIDDRLREGTSPDMLAELGQAVRRQQAGRGDDFSDQVADRPALVPIVLYELGLRLIPSLAPRALGDPFLLFRATKHRFCYRLTGGSA
jgi:hypothetical protein